MASSSDEFYVPQGTKRRRVQSSSSKSHPNSEEIFVSHSEIASAIKARPCDLPVRGSSSAQSPTVVAGQSNGPSIPPKFENNLQQTNQGEPMEVDRVSNSCTLSPEDKPTTQLIAWTRPIIPEVSLPDQFYHNCIDLLIDQDQSNNDWSQEVLLAPLFSWHVYESLKTADRKNEEALFPQFGMIGTDLSFEKPNPIFLNTNPPWSMFICGSQGSGKSHTLSCVLECSLIQHPVIKLPHQLSALVFHFDNGKEQEKGCQAAYLSSVVKTRVLVSPSNLAVMRRKYNDPNILVMPLYLSPKHLTVSRITRLMSVDMSKGTEVPLYMQIVTKVLREIAAGLDGEQPLDWNFFKNKLKAEGMVKGQSNMLKLRLDLIESFMRNTKTEIPKTLPLQHPLQHGPMPPMHAGPNGLPAVPPATRRRNRGEPMQVTQGPNYVRTLVQTSADIGLFIGAPGQLTVIDLSDPMLDPETACTLFDISLELFVAHTECGKIVALDEAHSYMKQTSQSAIQLTNRLITNVREQRHRAVRVIIATQEPTINDDLLDLCSIAVVHRFSSPAWFQNISQHLAGVKLAAGNKDGNEILREIVRLNVGESLVFCPTAAWFAGEDWSINKLNEEYLKMKTRKRITADGGTSRMASHKRAKV